VPGVVGCISHKTLNPNLITAMIQPMLHRPSYRVWKQTEKGFSIGTIDLAQDRQNGRAQSEDGRYLLTFFGAIYESWVNGDNSIASKLLDRFVTSGWKQVADLNGEYLIVVWDRTEEKLTIVNDRLGLKRLNYWQGNGIFAFAPEVKGLAVLQDVSRAIDEQALSELLTFGHLQDDRTLLRDVKMLLPASYLTWRKGKLSINQYWQFQHQADSKLEDSEYVITEYAHYVRQAVERRIKNLNRIGLFLSGGFDSRTLAGMARKVNPSGEICTYTTGHGHDHDSRYSKEIAKRICAKHTAVNIPETYLENCAPDYAWILDGSVTADGSHRATLNEFIQKENYIFLNGFLGDVLSGGKPLDQMSNITDLSTLIDTGFYYYAKGFNDGILKRILRPEIYGRIRGLAKEAFAKSVQSARVEHSADRVVQAELVQREQRGNPRIQVDYLNLGCQVVTPFTDRDFIDFTLRLPVSQRIKRKAYVSMILKEFPELSRVPKSGDGLPIAHSRLRVSIHWRWILFQRNALSKLTGNLWRPHNYAAFVHCDEWFSGANRNFIEKILTQNPLLENYFQMDALEQIVREYLDRDKKEYPYLGIASLISFALFHEKLEKVPIFTGREQSACVA